MAETRNIGARLLDVIQKHYTTGRSRDGDAYLVAQDGPRIALPLEGNQRTIEDISLAYFREYGAVVTEAAIRQALNVVAAFSRADDSPVRVGLRVVRAPSVYGDRIFLDLGREDGLTVRIWPGGWDFEGGDEVLFRRTSLTRALEAVPDHPEPVDEAGLPQDPGPRPYGLSTLRDLFGLTPEAWATVLGWLTAALIPDMPHPVLVIQGEQGTGKSVLARALVRLVDGAGVGLQGPPKEEGDLLATLSSGWVVGFDNVSHVPEWLSDALCRVATGDTIVKRQLYTTANMVSFRYQLPVLLTTIGLRGMNADLADRSVKVIMEPITDAQRRTEAEIWQTFRAAFPYVLGDLLSLVADVLGQTGQARFEGIAKARMADYAIHLRALDMTVPGLGALETYFAGQAAVVEDVLEGDTVALAVLRLIEEEGGWEGTAADLLARLPMLGVSQRDLPSNPRAASVALKRAQPALRSRGVDIRKRPSNGTRLIQITKRVP